MLRVYVQQTHISYCWFLVLYPIVCKIFLFIGDYTLIYTYFSFYTSIYIDIYIIIYVKIYIDTYIHAYIHTYMHTYIHIYVYTLHYMYIHIHIYIYIYVCMYLNLMVQTFNLLSTTNHCLQICYMCLVISTCKDEQIRSLE